MVAGEYGFGAWYEGSVSRPSARKGTTSLPLHSMDPLLRWGVGLPGGVHLLQKVAGGGPPGKGTLGQGQPVPGNVAAIKGGCWR